MANEKQIMVMHGDKNITELVNLIHGIGNKYVFADGEEFYHLAQFIKIEHSYPGVAEVLEDSNAIEEQVFRATLVDADKVGEKVRRSVVTQYLTIEELRSMLRSTSPAYKMMENLKFLGEYSDLSGWRWKESEIKKLSKDSLYDMYHQCVASWI